MKTTSLLIILVSLMFTNKGCSQNLSDYKWKNRVLILSDITDNRNNSKSAYNLVNSKLDAWKERDVILLFLINKELMTAKGGRIKYKPELPKKFNGYILIGKDGGIKLKETYPLIPKKVFELIDGMPMRKAEMRFNDNQ